MESIITAAMVLGMYFNTVKWNKEKKTYDLPTEVTLYRSAGPNLTSVRTYRMNEQKDMMYLISKKVIPRSRINHG